MNWKSQADSHKEDVDKIIENKKLNAEASANIKYKQHENEINKKNRDEDKMELMTQFMLDPTSSATKLLEKRREMYELQEALQQDKINFNEKETQFKKTEEQLRNKDEEFHKKICDYYMNTFEKKQSDAHANTAKIQQEKKAIREMKNEIENLQNKNKKLAEDLQKLSIIQGKLKTYSDFLATVKTKHQDSFSDIESVIEKYNILKNKHDEIEKETKETEEKKEKEKRDFRSEKSRLELSINKIVSDISKLQQELKKLKDDKKNLENEVTLMESNSNTVVSSLEMILLAVDNIYDKCAKKSTWTQHGDPAEFGNYDKKEKDKKKLYSKRVQEAKTKIRYINAYIADYEKITQEYNKQKKLSNNK